MADRAGATGTLQPAQQTRSGGHSVVAIGPEAAQGRRITVYDEGGEVTRSGWMRTEAALSQPRPWFGDGLGFVYQVHVGGGYEYANSVLRRFVLSGGSFADHDLWETPHGEHFYGVVAGRTTSDDVYAVTGTAHGSTPHRLWRISERSVTELDLGEALAEATRDEATDWAGPLAGVSITDVDAAGTTAWLFREYLYRLDLPSLVASRLPFRYVNDAVLSPDGTKLAIAFQDGERLIRRRVVVASPNGQHLSEVKLPTPRGAASPVWAPSSDALLVAAAESPTGRNEGVFLVDLAAGEIRKLSADAVFAAEPVGFSADGRRAFVVEHATRPYPVRASDGPEPTQQRGPDHIPDRAPARLLAVELSRLTRQVVNDSIYRAVGAS